MLDKKIKAHLVLENGTILEGTAFGHLKDTVGEVVFFTNSTSYQEILTLPSNTGKIIVLTNPLIGNYGINLEDNESEFANASGLIVRECSDLPNNWRCEMELDGFLKQHKIMAIQGIDTRALTKILRREGTMRGIITLRLEDLSPTQIANHFKTPSEKKHVFRSEIETFGTKSKSGATHLGIIDLGMTASLIKEFRQRNVKFTAFPPSSSLETLFAQDCDGLLISSGPYYAEDYPEVIALAKELIKTKPVFGIGMGHHILALALGCEVKKHTYGHHGTHYAVKENGTDIVYVTKQNQSQYVSELAEKVVSTHTNVIEGIIEGIQHETLPVASVKFIPETTELQHHTGIFYDRMLKTMEGGKRYA